MKPETLQQLKQISTPKLFAKDDYICHEGQPGNEMYIVLTGSVGVFVTNAIGVFTQVATIKEGDFFGEMAIFDNLPRSASCIAMEDTIAVAVTGENLLQLLGACPEIAKQMLENMSGRIRRLDAELYQNNRFVKNRHVPRFELPSMYKSGHMAKPPYQDSQYLLEYKQACPICGKAVSVTGIKRNKLELRTFEMDCRMTYRGCEPLWYEIISCPNCYYSNHYLRFFGINNFEFDIVQKVLEKEHRPIVEYKLVKRGDFDILVLKYLQAIHINKHINPGDNLLLGGLWRNLYWLSKDVSDMEFATYCAKNAIAKYKAAIDDNQITDVSGKTATALTLASLMVYCNETNEISRYVDIAMESPDARVREHASKIKAWLEKSNR